MSDSEWLESLNVGDPVLIDNGGGWGNRLFLMKRGTVVKTTKPQIDVRYGESEYVARFRRSDGYRLGSARYHSDFLREPDADTLAGMAEAHRRFDLERTVNRLDSRSIRGLSIDKLEALAKVVNEILPAVSEDDGK